MQEFRTIVTKHKVYRVPIEDEGIPVEERFKNTRWPGGEMPAHLIGARIYETEDGPIIACRNPVEAGV